MHEARGGDGRDVGGRRHQLGGGRTQLRVVHHGPYQRSAGSADLHRGGLSAAGVGGPQEDVVPQAAEEQRHQHHGGSHALLLTGHALHGGLRHQQHHRAKHQL